MRAAPRESGLFATAAFVEGRSTEAERGFEAGRWSHPTLLVAYEAASEVGIEDWCVYLDAVEAFLASRRGPDLRLVMGGQYRDAKET